MTWLRLLSPGALTLGNVVRRSDARTHLKHLFFVALGLGFWVGLFILCIVVLKQFLSVEIFGIYLVRKLISMLLLALFSLLCFSNLISALSSYFLSDDLPLLQSLPITLRHLHAARFVQTFLNSSWMAALFGTPVLLAYGVVFSAGISYYVALLFYLIPFLMVPTAVGVIAATVLVCIFPAQRARDLMMLASLGLIVTLLVMLRFLQPEQLVDAGSFSDIVSFLSQVQTPTVPLLPAHWGVEILGPLAVGQTGQAPRYLALTGLTGVAGYVLSGWVVLLLYPRAWTRAQEGSGSDTHTSGVGDRFLWTITSPLPRPMQSIIVKDIKTFFRDSAEWPQLLLILALMSIYLYSIKVLPLGNSFVSERLKNFIAFLNLGMVGFVMSAIAVRFLFTSVSVEGRAFWLLRASPLSPMKFLISKLVAGLPLLLGTGLTLVLASNWLLNTDRVVSVLGVITVLFLTFSLAGLSVGLGAMYPNFKAENVAKIASGPGGILFMIISQLFVGGIISLEAVPVWLFLRATRQGRPLFPWEQGLCIGLLLFTFVPLVVGGIWPMRRGARHIAEGL